MEMIVKPTQKKKKIKGHSISLEKFQLKLIIWVTISMGIFCIFKYIFFPQIEV